MGEAGLRPLTDISLDLSGFQTSHRLITEVYMAIKGEGKSNLACEFLTEAASSKGDRKLLLKICSRYITCL